MGHDPDRASGNPAAWHRPYSFVALLLLMGCAAGEAVSQRAPLRPPDYPGAASASHDAVQTVTTRYAPADATADPESGSQRKRRPGKVETVSATALRNADEPMSPQEPPWARNTVRIAALDSDAERPDAALPVPESAFDVGNSSQPLPPIATDSPDERDPIDLATVLQLAGANHLQIALAAEQVREAAARLDRAEVLWVPTIDVGVGYNRHDGRIQDTEGRVFDVSRQSGFIGGGPRIGPDGPQAGPGAGPPRLFIGLNPAEAYFAPLAARQETTAADANRAATFKDTLLEVGVTYYDLVNARMRVAIADEAEQNTRTLAELAEDFVRAGVGLPADLARIQAQLAQMRVELLDARREQHVTSAELARLLRLDPTVTLDPADPLPLPVVLIPEDAPLPELIGQGLMARPELLRHRARAAAAQARLRQEQWRPWVPNIFLAGSAGGMGGGPNSSFSNFGGRHEFDALAVWSVENLGFGNQARQREQASLNRQELLDFHFMSDRVAAEVAQAYYQVQIGTQQIEAAEAQVAAAAEAMPLNFRGVRDLELRPIEAQQAIGQLAEARRVYLKAVVEFDQAQLRLLRAIGNPPDLPIASAPPVAPPDWSDTTPPPAPE